MQIATVECTPSVLVQLLNATVPITSTGWGFPLKIHFAKA